MYHVVSVQLHGRDGKAASSRIHTKQIKCIIEGFFFFFFVNLNLMYDVYYRMLSIESCVKRTIEYW